MIKVEVELVTSEVTMIVSSLRHRAMEMEDSQKDIYEKLTSEMSGIGLYVFNASDAIRICIALQEFAKTHEAVLGATQRTKKIKTLAEMFFNMTYEKGIDRIDQALQDMSERKEISFA